MNELIKAQEDFIAIVNKVSTADGVIIALNTLTDVMVKIKPQMALMEKKYPEIKDEKNSPTELKAIKEHFEIVRLKFVQSMEAVLTKFENNEKVLKAFQDMMSKAQ